MRGGAGGGTTTVVAWQSKNLGCPGALQYYVLPSHVPWCTVVYVVAVFVCVCGATSAFLSWLSPLTYRRCGLFRWACIVSDVSPTRVHSCDDFSLLLLRASAKYITHALPLIKLSLVDSNAGVRRNAAFCAGTLAQGGGEAAGRARVSRVGGGGG